MAVRIHGRGERPRFAASLQSDGTLELLIYEDIGPDYWSYSGGITAKTIRQQIDENSSCTRLAVRIDSDGGDAFDGIAIYNVLRAQKKPVDVYVDGLAASAASIIAMAGDTITMAVNTCMMIHNASAIVYGTAAALRQTAEALDTVSEAIAQTYVSRTGKPLADILALLDAETWMTAQECLAQKFCTAVAETTGLPEPSTLDARRRAIAARLHLAARAEAKTKRVDGEDLTWDDFIVALDHEDISTWHLPWKFKTLEKTKAHLRNALARFDQVQGLSKEQKHAAWRKLVSLCKKYGIDVASEDRARFHVWAKAEGGVCECDCDNCIDANCAACNNPECDDSDCLDCPMQAQARSALSVQYLDHDIEIRKRKSALLEREAQAHAGAERAARSA
jgi:ATP-dependent protease ClpP protease subunit